MHDYCKLTSSAQSRVREQTQMHLFKQTVSELVRRWRVPIAAVEGMYELDLLSFSPHLNCFIFGIVCLLVDAVTVCQTC